MQKSSEIQHPESSSWAVLKFIQSVVQTKRQISIRPSNCGASKQMLVCHSVFLLDSCVGNKNLIAH